MVDAEVPGRLKFRKIINPKFHALERLARVTKKFR